MTIKVTQPWPPADSAAGAPAPHVEHLLAPNPSSWTYEGTNSYVIGHGGSSLIVDPGVPDDDHLQTLMRMSLAGDRTPMAVLLTHDHPDHSDGAREVAGVLGVPVLCLSPRFADELPADGAVLDVDGLDVHVLHTPGHSDDSLCFWMPSTGALLTGDTLLGARSAGVMGRLGELLRSVEMLRALTADRDAIGLPGHGPAFTDVAASATRVIGVRTRRIDQVRGYLADGDASLASLSARVYPDVTGTRAKFGESTVVSTLEYLAEIDGGIPDPLREQVSAEIAEYYVERSRRHREEAAARAASH